MGSIPIARSISLDDSITLTRLSYWPILMEHYRIRSACEGPVIRVKEGRIRQAPAAVTIRGRRAMGVMKVHVDWRLRHGIASPTNFAVLLAVLLAFPLVLRWTGAFSVGQINPQSAQHTRAFLKFCFILTAFLWVCFAIALVGIRRSGRITWQELAGMKWSRWQTIVGDPASLLPH